MRQSADSRRRSRPPSLRPRRHARTLTMTPEIFHRHCVKFTTLQSRRRRTMNHRHRRRRILSLTAALRRRPAAIAAAERANGRCTASVVNVLGAHSAPRIPPRRHLIQSCCSHRRRRRQRGHRWRRAMVVLVVVGMVTTGVGRPLQRRTAATAMMTTMTRTHSVAKAIPAAIIIQLLTSTATTPPSPSPLLLLLRVQWTPPL